MEPNRLLKVIWPRCSGYMLRLGIDFLPVAGDTPQHYFEIERDRNRCKQKTVFLSEWGFQVQRTPLYYIGIYWIVLTLCNHQWRFSEIKMTNPIFKICLCTVPLGEDSWGIRYGCGSKALYLVPGEHQNSWYERSSTQNIV